MIGARSRSFRFLVRLIERLPVLALPAWRDNRTQPIDGRDVLEFLARAARRARARPAARWDIAGPDVMSYGEMIERIATSCWSAARRWRTRATATGRRRVAAAIAGEDADLIDPLMESLEHDLLPRDDAAPDLFGVRLHRFDAAVERALRDWEEREALAAR